MSLLEQVKVGITQPPRKTLIYGIAGVGKTTFASNSESPIVIQTEEGSDHIGVPRFPLAKSRDDVVSQIGALYTEKHEYKTLVLDSLDWLEKLYHAAVCLDRNVKNIQDIGYAKGFDFAMTYWRELVDGLDALRNDRGMNIILIAHSEIKKFENPETEAYDRYRPRLHEKAAAMMVEWADDVLFACYKVFTKKVDEGFGKEKHQGIATGERILRTTDRPAHVAKNRADLPDEIPLDYRTYARLVRGEAVLA